MVSRQRRREPHVVVHLNMEGFRKRVWKWSIGMIEISEIRGINWDARKNSRG